jgi:glutaredoxin-like protein
MPLISQENQNYLRDRFSKELVNDVSVTVFTQHDSTLSVPSEPCTYCKDTTELMKEVASLSDKIKLDVLDFVADKERAKQMGVDKIPAIVFDGVAKNRVKYYGIPSGYEFSSLIEDIIDVSRGKTDLSDKTKQALQALSKDLHIQVFVTPT